MKESLANKIGFVSLGCPKALVDSERIISQLRAEGYDFVSRHEDANLVIVNTCGFIDSAVEESMDSIAEAMTKNGKVIVTGCLGAKAELLRERFPDLLQITGPQDYESVVSAVHQQLPPKHQPLFDLIPEQGVKLTPRHYAYLKISEGCNHKCSFCIIPSMRGNLASRSINHVMTEAERLVNAGVKELLIIAQDTSAYGVDTKYQADLWHGQPIKTRFYELVQALSKLPAWIRLHYVYPYPHVDDIIPFMNEGNILPYLDIPFQHATPRILKLMKRPACSENNLERIRKWREICPKITLRSTFIVGFPGETDAEFEELLAFLRLAKLDRVGCFEYSPVAGAKANDLPDHVPDEVKHERFHRFMQTQQAISLQKQQQKIGQALPVIIDEFNQGQAVGRSQADAPGIDGQVYVTAHHMFKVGDIIEVKIDDADAYDLFGHSVSG